MLIWLKSLNRLLPRMNVISKIFESVPIFFYIKGYEPGLMRHVDEAIQ